MSLVEFCGFTIWAVEWPLNLRRMSLIGLSFTIYFSAFLGLRVDYFGSGWHPSRHTVSRIYRVPHIKVTLLNPILKYPLETGIYALGERILKQKEKENAWLQPLNRY